MKKVVYEKNKNQIASRSKIFMAAVLDFCIHMVLLMLLFGIASVPILNNSTLYANFNVSRDEFFNHIKETKLYTFDENGEPINSNYGALSYTITLIKTSYYYEGEEYSELVDGKETIIEVNEDDLLEYEVNGELVNDNLGYYFISFRESTNSDLPNEVKTNYGDYSNKYNYFYSGALELNLPSNKVYFNSEIYSDSNGNINELVKGKPLLNFTTAEILHDYICLNKDSEEGKKAFDIILKMYNGALNFAFMELDTYSPIYKSYITNLDDQQNHLLNMQFLSLFLTYVVSFGIYFVLIPVFLKEGRTLGFKVCRLTYSTINDDYPKARNIIVKDILLFFTDMIVIILPILFMGNMQILFSNLFLGVKPVYLIIFLTLLSLISISMACFNKKHQFLGEYVALLVSKDIDSLVVNEENSVIDETK